MARLPASTTTEGETTAARARRSNRPAAAEGTTAVYLGVLERGVTTGRRILTRRINISTTTSNTAVVVDREGEGLVANGLVAVAAVPVGCRRGRARGADIRGGSMSRETTTNPSEICHHVYCRSFPVLFCVLNLPPPRPCRTKPDQAEHGRS